MVTAQTTRVRQARSKAPIPTRKPSFDFDSVDERLWYDGNGIITSFFSALSATFPPGEKEFVRSVLHYRDQITDETLREQMRGFASQEGQHAFQHRRANEWLDSKGFGAAEIVSDVEAQIAKLIASGTPPMHLASTVCLEHITAILAHFMLTNPDVMAKMPDPVRELLEWHAVEEIEHKAVAFDVFEAVSGDRRLLRKMMAYITGFFLFHQTRRATETVRRLGHKPTAREALEAARFFLGRRGLITGVARHYVDFYRSDFHPWDLDDRELVEQWQARRPAV